MVRTFTKLVVGLLCSGLAISMGAPLMGLAVDGTTPATFEYTVPASPLECMATTDSLKVTPTDCLNVVQLSLTSASASGGATYEPQCTTTGSGLLGKHITTYCPGPPDAQCGQHWSYTGFVGLHGIGKAWYSDVNFRMHWTECSVGSEAASGATDYVNCDNYGGVGFKVTIDWCGHANDGTELFDLGDDFHVAALFRGFPLEFPHYIRMNVDQYGNVTTQAS